MKVYVVTGYFGSDEWIESIWLNEEKATEEMLVLWAERKSPVGPSYAQGVMKFGVDEYDVRDG